MRLKIGSDNSDLILPMRIMKPSGQSHADRVPITQWRHLSVGQSLTGYPVNKRWHRHTMRLKCMKQVQEEELQRLLTAQSEVESLGVVKLADPVRSIEDRRALAVMEQTTNKLEGEDAYMSGLL